MAQVQAVNSRTRRKQIVPAYWVGAKNPDGSPRRFGGAFFTEPPSRKGRGKAASKADTTPATGDDTKKES